MAWSDDLKNAYIKTAYLTASADLKISYTDSLAILQTAKANGITATEIEDLKSIYSNAAALYTDSYVKTITKNILYDNLANLHWWGGVTNYNNVKTLGNLATGCSESNYQYLLDKWFYGSDIPMPIIGGDSATGKVFDSTYSYALASGPLFVSGVAATDVNQGGAGTCYLLASLGALAHTKPDAISNMFVDNGNNTYGVKFYDNANQTYYTTVNKQLPVSSGNQLALAGNMDNSLSGELWVALAEKAYAQFNSQLSSNLDANSYQAVEGGWATPLKQIANLNYNYYSSYFNVPDPYKLKEYDSTNPSTYKQAIIDGLNAGGVGWLATFGNTYGSNGKQNFVDGHAFMLLGYDSVTDKFIVRNPWGGDGSSDYNPQFTAPISEFWNANVQGVVAVSTGTAAPAYSYTIATNASSSNPTSEGEAINFTITRSDSGTTSTVYLSTAAGTAGNADYAPLNKQAVTFAANETSKLVTVNTLTDALNEATENFSLQLFKNSTDSTASASTSAYIKNLTTANYSYTLTSSSSVSNPVTEGSAITFTITRSGSGATSTVYVSTAAATAGNADYEALSKQAITFAANETLKTFNVNTYTDALTEGTENFSLQLYKNQADSTAAASSNAYIKDAPPQNYSYTVTSNASDSANPAKEGSAITFTIARSSSGTASTVFVSSLNGTAGAADYVGISKQAVSFDAYETTKTITINSNVDWWLENTEYFYLAVYKNQSDALDAYHSKGVAYLTDSLVDPYSYALTSNADSSNPVSEGAAISFTITRSGNGAATDTTSTVYLSTATGTAGNADYASLNKQAITFAANETSKAVTVNSYTDALIEGNEYFYLNLYKNYADTGYTGYAQAYIKDVTVPSYSYSITSNAKSASSAVTEGNAVSFTITRSATGSLSTVYVSTANGTAGNSDYTALDKQAVTFAANETSKSVTVNSSTDSLTEGSEYFYLDLYKNYSDSTAAYSAYGTAYIKDASAPNYSYTVTSNAGSSNPASEGETLSFTITRSGSGAASTVYVATADGTAGSADYAALNKQAVAFAAYETSKTISINTYTDSLTEANEYFWLKLYKNYADVGYSSYASAYIKDAATQNYSYAISANAEHSDSAVTEGAAVTFTITRSTSGTVSTVYVSTEGGSATETSDYASLDKQAVTFAAYETSKTVTVNTYSDALQEDSEYFYLNLYKNYADNVYDYSDYATAYIKDPETIPNYSYSVTSTASSSNAVTEGSAVSFTITRNSSGTAATVYLSTEGGSATEGVDYVALDKQAVTFAADETSKTISVNSYTDALTEGKEYFYLNLYKNYTDNAYDYSSYAAAFIKDAVAPKYNYAITSNASNTNPVTEGSAITFTITRSGSGAASTVYLSTAEGTAGNADYAALNKQALNFAANETSKTVTVNSYTDALSEGKEYFWLTLYKNYADNNYANYGTAYIKDAATQNYNYSIASSASNTAASEGDAITFTLTRSGSGSASTVYVSTEDGSADHTDYAALNKQAVTFAANETSKTLTVNTYQDTLTEGKEYFWLNLYKNYSDSFYDYAAFKWAYIDDPSSGAAHAVSGSKHSATATLLAALDNLKIITDIQADYDSNSSKLYYDADGSSTAATVQVTLIGVDSHPDPAYSDIQIIG